MPQKSRHIRNREASAPTPVRMDGKSFDVVVTGTDTTPHIGFKEREVRSPKPDDFFSDDEPLDLPVLGHKATTSPDHVNSIDDNDYFDEALELPVLGRMAASPDPVQPIDDDDFYDEALELPVLGSKAIVPEPDDFFDEHLELPVRGRKADMPEPDTLQPIEHDNFFDEELELPVLGRKAVEAEPDDIFDEPLELPVRGLKGDIPDPDTAQTIDDDDFYDGPLDLPVLGLKVDLSDQDMAPATDIDDFEPDDFCDEEFELPVLGRKAGIPDPALAMEKVSIERPDPKNIGRILAGLNASRSLAPGATPVPFSPSPSNVDTEHRNVKYKTTFPYDVEEATHHITAENLTELHQTVRNLDVVGTYQKKLRVLSDYSQAQHTIKHKMLSKLKFLQSELCKVEESLGARK